MRDRAKQLMDLLWRQSGEPAALTLSAEPEVFDLDATEFLNPEAGAVDTLVLAPDPNGRQLIVDRVPDNRRSRGLPSGHWHVWAEVLCWSVQVTVHEKTLPHYPGWLPAGEPGSEPDLIGRISECYLQFGARRESPDIVRFTEAVFAAEFITELWTVLAEHGAGARFRTTLLARTISGERCRWTVTRQETLKPLVEHPGEPGRSKWWPMNTPHKKRGEA